jgi:hypothetical protein
MRLRTCVALAGLVAVAAATEPAAAHVVSVDFARRVAARPVFGVLHGIDMDEPRDAMIAPLAPRWWRGDLASAPYERVRTFGSRYIVVISDLWGYPGANWYGRRPPWEDLDGWAHFVRRLARLHRNHDFIWDVWNEPDQPYFWNGTQEQFQRTYETAYDVLREELGPGAIVAGPSTSSFRWSWLVGLLEYCRLADCEVNALSWHELPGDSLGITRISSHLRRARTELVRNPAYVVLGLRELHINEVVGVGDSLFPGEQVAYLAELEHGHATLSTRACWLDPTGMDNCAAHTLDGLLDPVSMRPRGPWWVTRWYARGVATRVWGRPLEGAVEVLAAARSPRRGRAEVLIGMYDPHDGSEPVERLVRVDLAGLDRLPFVKRRPRLGVVSFRVPATGAAPTRPRAIAAQAVPVHRGTAAVSVLVRPHEAVLLRLLPARELP